MDPLPPAAVEEALRYWYGLINYEQRAPLAIDLKLERMRALLAALGQPQRRLRVVHVAGSKGKGSTSAMLAAILRSAGYRTGLFTSPHLMRVEERFQVDGHSIFPEELVRGILDVRKASDRGPRSVEFNTAEGREGSRDNTLTFFEVATAVGFLHFVRRRVHAAVIEVGLGGRFDSTNVCEPAVAIVTSISHDHTKLLGDQLASIAFEKAGILKAGRPAISGATVPEARAVIERAARERGCRLRQLGRDFRYTYRPGRVADDGLLKSRVLIETETRAWPELELNLLGEHQAANAALVVACVEELRNQGWHLPDHAVSDGLAGVVWPARMELMGRNPWIVLDCAHNVASALALEETLRTSFPPGRRLLIFAGSNDKDLAGMFKVFAPHFHHAFLTRYTSNARAVPPEQLLKILRSVAPLAATVYDVPAQALAAARLMAGTNDLICLTGSVFLAGEIRPLLTK